MVALTVLPHPHVEALLEAARLALPALGFGYGAAPGEGAGEVHTLKDGAPGGHGDMGMWVRGTWGYGMWGRENVDAWGYGSAGWRDVEIWDRGTWGYRTRGHGVIRIWLGGQWGHWGYGSGGWRDMGQGDTRMWRWGRGTGGHGVGDVGWGQRGVGIWDVGTRRRGDGGMWDTGIWDRGTRGQSQAMTTGTASLGGERGSDWGHLCPFRLCHGRALRGDCHGVGESVPADPISPHISSCPLCAFASAFVPSSVAPQPSIPPPSTPPRCPT